MPTEFPELNPLRAMLRVLSPELRLDYAAALNRLVNAPASAAAGRIDDLLLVAQLLDQQPQPPESMPYIERREYDAQRIGLNSQAPSSSRLVKQYGSWARVCTAAFGLRADGRNVFGGSTLMPRSGRGQPRKFTPDECIASLRNCATILGHIPSASEYQAWYLRAKRRARATGRGVRIASVAVVIRELAPDERRGLRWRTALGTAFTWRNHLQA
jgi:hypothetical protein